MRLKFFTAPSNTEFDEFGILLNVSESQCKIQWLLSTFRMVFMRITTPTVFPVTEFTPSAQTSIRLFQTIW
jgi:hypothetical protein